MIEIDDIMIMDTLKQLCVPLSDGNYVAISPIPQAGSDRRYFRLSYGNHSCIGTYVPDADEGECFVKLAADLYSAGRHVPKIYAVSRDFHYYLQEDLGDTSLFSSLKDANLELLMMQTLDRLVQLQKTPVEIWKKDCISNDFCRRQVMWDLNYFKYEYVKPSNVIFNEDFLEDDMEKLADRLISIRKYFWGFMMRDCQSRNVMMTYKGPVFIDFQGGRFGPSLYDAVSLLWQARAGFGPDFRSKMLDYYTGRYCEGNTELKKEMLQSLVDLVLFRTLQVLGAYGFRGLVQHRSHFLMSIPAALSNLKELLEAGVIECYPELGKVASKLIADMQPKETIPVIGLTVEIFSFSYKKGYPRDMSGNGGGFMFDCRAMRNPGRYKEYKNLTGRDKEVIDFLEIINEVGPFLKNAWAMTDAAVERFISRGFSHLQVGFGCTGGQHRSVYCADRTAQHIRRLFPEVNVVLTHREHPAR